MHVLDTFKHSLHIDDWDPIISVTVLLALLTLVSAAVFAGRGFELSP